MEFTLESNKFVNRDESGKVLAEVDFPAKDDNTIVITHTFVDESLRGRGIGMTLMEAVIDYARSNDKKISYTCPYAVKYFESAGERYADVLRK